MSEAWERFLEAKREARAQTRETKRKNERRYREKCRDAYRARADLLVAARELFRNDEKSEP